jgi:hypothetical protein
MEILQVIESTQSSVTISDKIQLLMVFGTFLAVLVALFGQRLWEFWDKPVLKILFKQESPSCHKTSLGGRVPVYYFRFIVKNTGNKQAEDCEAYLEKIKKLNDLGKCEEYTNFTPVNLKWSGFREPIQRTIYPDKETFCDLGKIVEQPQLYESKYVNATTQEQKLNKFIFELPEVYYSQWDCLLPGKYITTISIYSRNAKVVTRDFEITWSGNWKSNDTEMFKELVIS